MKDLGFREKCVAYYDTADNVGLLYNTQYTCDVIPCQYDDLLESRNSVTEYEVDAPTLYDAQKWLRGEKILVTVGFLMTGDGDWEYEVQNCRGLHKLSTNMYNTYEEALLEGIKEAIKILKEK